MNIVNQVHNHFLNNGDEFSPETEQEYINVVESLSGEWRQVSDLPFDNWWYQTLHLLGLIDRKDVPVYWENQPRGFHIFYKLKD